jgi:hypothetical protein
MPRLVCLLVLSSLLDGVRVGHGRATCAARRVARCTAREGEAMHSLPDDCVVTIGDAPVDIHRPLALVSECDLVCQAMTVSCLPQPLA